MGEEEAEEQRMSLISKLLSNSTVIDHDGAIQVAPLTTFPWILNRVPLLAGRA